MYMKHTITCIIGAGLLLMATWGCRKDSDVLLPYNYNDLLVYKEAYSSFAAKFDVLWNGMNQNYTLWDYEAEQGLDWDAVYDEYYPKFKALDQRGEGQTVTNDELSALLNEFLGPLHDGHFYVSLYNHKTGSVVDYMPAKEKISKRDDYNTVQANRLHLGYYLNPANGEVETDAEGNPIVKEATTNVQNLTLQFIATPNVGGQWLLSRIKELEARTGLTDLEAFELQQLKDLKAEIYTLLSLGVKERLAALNKLQAEYSFLNIPGFEYIDPAFAGINAIDIRYALLKGNIAYLSFSDFNLSSYLVESESNKAFDMSRPYTRQLVSQVKAVWQAWYDSIQTLHKAGKLGGVIIDVRNNGGGLMADSKYVVGSLVPGSYTHYGYERYKRGTGRYDYSPLFEAREITMDEPHEDVTDVPVAVLVNCMSVSMAEATALSAKTMPLCKVIGKRSFGALGSLSDMEYVSYNYSGRFGERGVTPVFGNVPYMAFYDLDKQLIEGVGVIPDIEVDFDTALFQATGQDTQLDRALQYIRNGQ